MPVLMELSRIILSELNDQQFIFLKEADGERTFPIVIGLFEAASIERRVKGTSFPRPQTHDLVVNAVENLGGEFQDVVITVTMTVATPSVCNSEMRELESDRGGSLRAIMPIS